MPGPHRLSREQIEGGQLASLRQLVGKLVPANSFYASKLSGLDLNIASLTDYRDRFPFTLKSELVSDQLAVPPYGTNLTYPLEEYTRYHQTSGTSGAPLRWLDTPGSWDGLVESWGTVMEAAGVTASDRLFLAFSFGPFLGFWLAFEAGTRLGALCIPGGGLSSVSRVKTILENRATVLCCTPTYALRLAEAAAETGLGLANSKIRLIIVAGEAGGSIPAVRLKIEELWPGARIFDHHGMTEVGPATYECPTNPGVLHFVEDSYFAEIVEPYSTKQVPRGEPGELVLTTLKRDASPLLRYRTGDLVCRSKTDICSCGRAEFALTGGILTRCDDMIVVRGVNIYPGAVEHLVLGNPEVAEYLAQVSVRNSLTELTLTVEPTTKCADPAALIEKLEQQLQSSLALRIPVQLASPNQLPRFEMKSKRWQKLP